MDDPYFTTPIARHVWEAKYRYRKNTVVYDATIADSWRRIASTLAAGESSREYWQARFYDILHRFKFLPGGRIQAGVGTAHKVTLFNCFVMGTIPDAMEGIFNALKEGALTMQQGGGVGYDFSTLRPRGTQAYNVGSVASGPVSFMHIWDSMCATILSTGARRGAMMGTLRCDHPDIEEFIAAKQDRTRLRHFNISVLVSDGFLAAVRKDEDWPLVFPVGEHAVEGEVVLQEWPGYEHSTPCKLYKRIRARALWEKIMRATYDYAEPGILFIDRINQLNNLYYCERIHATNPCGEVPLPPYGACNLGSINLTQFVCEPFTEQAHLDIAAIGATASTAVRLLDNVIDASNFPLPNQAAQARCSRRIGLGITGLADTLMMLNIRYGSKASLQAAQSVMQAICHTAYRTSVEIAREKGSFPSLDQEKYLAGAFVRTLPESIRHSIAQHGIRNSHLTAIAPTGTISLLANNISSSLEPVFDSEYTRRVLGLDGGYSEYQVVDYAVACWRKMRGHESLPPSFINAHQLPPTDHLQMQAAIQPYVDQAISKTINVPTDYDFGAFRNLYQHAYDLGLKGCTTFRPNPVTGTILSQIEEEQTALHCCNVEREAD
ncbi:adenosylcobalamin-dependent ribonucleoside-diphosphate reductase [Nitrosomonas sp. Nm58]|uniref:adenosylcobalamin-dependent ribonucleoside-diphosphate reductase n=1 Tax=Nitrosomonas sp. Nm58 TaxID=200126 RepID=UPI0008996764|nr:adenosylcobalamin-dependent ribonucleoside-diphosphate reductase [Nitrosomonas sp. Nm58]SDY53069.1 ribonucleoside-diphosphate reductase alpha chain [Nitrosomonas sp. Nm58]